jgi:hypothetical protein
VSSFLSSSIYFPTSSSVELIESAPIQFFFRVAGVLADFTSAAAEKLDDLVLPITVNGIFEENMIENHFVPEVLYDVCSGEAFWRELPLYNWSFMMFEKAFRLSRGNVYFLGQPNIIDSESWSGKFAWTYKNFGVYGVNHLLMSIDKSSLALACSGMNDILVTSVKAEMDFWNNAGGSGLYFPELDPRFAGSATIAGGRISGMDRIVNILQAKK